MHASGRPERTVHKLRRYDTHMYDLVQYLYAEQFAELHVHEFVHMDSEEIYSTVPPGLSINMEYDRVSM